MHSTQAKKHTHKKLQLTFQEKVMIYVGMTDRTHVLTLFSYNGIAL